MPTSNFNPSWDVVRLKNALKSGDKKAFAEVLCRRSTSQRLEIAAAYKLKCKKNLIDEVRSTFDGNVKSLFASLLMSSQQLYCHQLRKTRNDGIIENVATAILSLTTDLCETDKTSDDDVLIEVLCTMSNAEIRKILATYQQMYGKRLEQSIREDKSGKFKKLLKLLSECKRNESLITSQRTAKDDAETIYKSLKQKDENAIIEVLSSRSFPEVKAVNVEYKKLTGGRCLEKEIKKKTSDALKDALLAIVRTSNSPLEYYARRLNKSINNFLVDDRTLGRLIVVRCEIDLMDMKQEFARIFRKSIKSCLKDEISGSYRHALLLLLDEN